MSDKNIYQRGGFIKTEDFQINEFLKDSNGNLITTLLQIKPAANDTGTITIMYPDRNTETFDLSVEGMDSINFNPCKVIKVVATTLVINQDFKLYTK